MWKAVAWWISITVLASFSIWAIFHFVPGDMKEMANSIALVVIPLVFGIGGTIASISSQKAMQEQNRHHAVSPLFIIQQGEWNEHKDRAIVPFANIGKFSACNLMISVLDENDECHEIKSYNFIEVDDVQAKTNICKIPVKYLTFKNDYSYFRLVFQYHDIWNKPYYQYFWCVIYDQRNFDYKTQIQNLDMFFNWQKERTERDMPLLELYDIEVYEHPKLFNNILTTRQLKKTDRQYLLQLKKQR